MVFEGMITNASWQATGKLTTSYRQASYKLATSSRIGQKILC
jgi:hypothetical protein